MIPQIFKEPLLTFTLRVDEKDTLELTGAEYTNEKTDQMSFEDNAEAGFAQFTINSTWLMNKDRRNGGCYKFRRTGVENPDLSTLREQDCDKDEAKLHQSNQASAGLKKPDFIDGDDPTEEMIGQIFLSDNAKGRSSLQLCDSDILPCLQILFRSGVGICDVDEDTNSVSIIGERIDCQCDNACSVPISSAIMAETYQRSAFDEGEILSSGDELDKLESDTDSQDTVIEGEAYKRMRNVAIKEKILHANEELFGAEQKDSIHVSRKPDVEEATKKPCDDTKNHLPVLPICLDPEDSDFSSVHFLKEMFESIPVTADPKASNASNSLDSPFTDSVCSSESSDNGSDGEEVILSDTSTSSDEATYIVPTCGTQFQGHFISYKLHTIAEESCEESEASPKTSEVSSIESENGSHPNSETKEICSNKNYDRKLPLAEGSSFKSVLQTKKLTDFNFSKKDHSLVQDFSSTDRSTEISSDEESPKAKRRAPRKKSRKLVTLAEKGDFSSNDCMKQAQSAIETKLCPGQSPENDCKRTEMSEDETKYIMDHLITHISNENSHEFESPMIKELESEIVRLMLTVSPASLSAGEPSSSCSSTIGSNNSDYGSDTLESAEEFESNEEERNNLALVNEPSLKDSESAKDGETSKTDGHSENEPVQPEHTVSEETLYICVQLMASLKKITDASEIVPEGISSTHDDSSAKQYITDQIVSLMQTVNASQNSSPLFLSLQLDGDASCDPSDSDSPPSGGPLKSKTPSESGSETTISASISIPSYDDSDRTPTESEISHEMDELYALLERSSPQPQETPSQLSRFLNSEDGERASQSHSDDDDECNKTISVNAYPETPSLLCQGSSELLNILPISFEERIARFKDAFLMLEPDELKQMSTETLIEVEMPQTPPSDSSRRISNSLPLNLNSISKTESAQNLFSATKSFDDILSTHKSASSSDKYISSKTYPPSSAHFKKVNVIHPIYVDEDHCQVMSEQSAENKGLSGGEKNDPETLLPSIIRNAKEKASSENDLLVANYRCKSKTTKVFGTKSAGNICELENIKSTFRDTGYYSFKSSGDSFLSLDDSGASQTSTASLTKHRSLTSTETIPEEEEPSAVVAKMSLSSGNIPDAVCDTSASKSSTLPLSLRSKLGGPPGSNHRTRSSFFSTSGVLRKLTLLRDEGGNSQRSSPHASRMRMRNRSLSGGSEDGRCRKMSGCSEGSIPSSLSERVLQGEADQPLSYQSRSHLSLSSFSGGRSESITSVYSAAGGGRYGTVTVSGEVLFGCNYNRQTSTFEVTVKECRNLAPVDVKRNRSDPYVKVYLLPDRTKSGKRKTKIKKHTLNPAFGELLKFHLSLGELETRTLWLSVWHSDRFGRNDFLGEVMLPLGDTSLPLNWYPLQEKLDPLDCSISYKGDLILALKYKPSDASCQKAVLPVKGTLEILVRQARNLMATRSNGTSDPFCKSYLLPDKTKGGKQKTPVIKKSCNPQWNHTFRYEDLTLTDLRERCLELTIWDYDKITSNDFLGGVRLCLGAGKYQGKDVDWMDSVGEEQSLWYTMLERPDTWVEGSLLLRPSMQCRRALQ